MTSVLEDVRPGDSKKTVLVVEDEVALRFLVAMVLREDAGLTVVEAHSADDAMTLLRSGIAVDLVFTDVRMPGTMDGVELVRRIRTDFPGIRVVMTSGNLTQEERISGVPLFPKPYDIDKVAAQIVALVEEQDAD